MRIDLKFKLSRNLVRLGAALALVLAAVSGIQLRTTPVIADVLDAPGYVCFPTCAEKDGRFLTLLKTSGAAMTPPSIRLGLTAPPGAGSLSFDIFDADDAGLWDESSPVSLKFSLYDDPDGDGVNAGQVALQTWTSASLAACTAAPNNLANDNCWAGASYPTAGLQHSANGSYRFVLIVSAAGGGTSAFPAQWDPKLGIHVT